MPKKKSPMTPGQTVKNMTKHQKARAIEIKAALIANGLGDVLGFGGFGSGQGTELSQTDTLFKNNRYYLVSNQRQLLSWSYIQIGLIQTVVDIPVDDAFRGGIEIKTKELSAEEIEELTDDIDENGDIETIAQAMKWNRLFGGAGVIIMNGQKPDSVIDIEAMKEGDPLKFRAVDMWELFWSSQNANDSDPSFGPVESLADTDEFNYYGTQVSRSRVLVIKGKEAPSLIRPRMRGWGMSIVESIVRSINQYLKANDLTFEVLDEFKIDIYKIKNLTSSLMSADGENAVRRRVQLANLQKNYQHAITMDAEDDFLTKELTFTGLAETMQQIRMQVASELRMPLTKVFGISAQGFNSGEDDIENYNAMVESSIRQKAKYDIVKMVKLRCQTKFGFIPDNIKISFKPLRMLSAEQEENIKTQKFNRLWTAYQGGGITSDVFKDACNKDMLLGVQLENKDVLDIQPDEEGDDASGSTGDKAKRVKSTPKEAPEAKS